MTSMPVKTPVGKSTAWKRLLTLVLLFALILVSILVIRSFPARKSEFVDQVAGQIEQEMENSQIVLSAKPGRRTVAEFREPILTTHGRESRLIVHTAHLSRLILPPLA